MAARLHDLGYTEVNWNLGCPFRPVSKKRRGAGLLPFPEAIDEFLDRTVRALPMSLSIKMRLGRTTPDEIFKLLPVLDRYPLTQIVIHPRTARQMYGGRPDLDTFESCLALSRHRIVYNGDIVHVAGFKELQARFPKVDEWMIGRGALADPFLPAAIQTGADPGPDRVRRFKAFYDDLFDRTGERLSGPGHLLDRMKGYWTYFAAAFMGGEALAKQIHRTFQLPRYIDTVERFSRKRRCGVNSEAGGKQASGPADSGYSILDTRASSPACSLCHHRASSILDRASATALTSSLSPPRTPRWPA